MTQDAESPRPGFAQSLRKAVDYLLDRPPVDAAIRERLDRWRALPIVDLALPHSQLRYVVVATQSAEATLRQGRLTALGAVAVSAGTIDFADGYEYVYREPHGEPVAAADGGEAEGRADGGEPKAAMLDFLAYLGKSPLVAFGADEHLAAIARGVRSLLGYPLEQPWFDLAVLLDTVCPAPDCATRDDWLAHFGLEPAVGHTAAGDALAAAQLLQIALVAAERSGYPNADRIIARQKARSAYGRYR